MLFYTCIFNNSSPFSSPLSDNWYGSTMQWSDGTPVTFSKYFSYGISPANAGCAKLDVVHGEKVWIPDDCLVTFAPYICKAMATSTNIDWDIRGKSKWFDKRDPLTFYPFAYYVCSIEFYNMWDAWDKKFY